MKRGAKVIETERLLLRRLVPGDAAFMLGLLNDPDWIRFIGDRGVRSIDAAREYLISGPIAMYGLEGFGLYRVEQKIDAQPVGVCGLIKRPELADADLGFAFMPQSRGRGYGVEAARATLDHGLGPLGMRRIVAITSPDNDDSMRLLERIGMRFERRAVLFEGDDEVNLFAIGGAALPPTIPG